MKRQTKLKKVKCFYQTKKFFAYKVTNFVDATTKSPEAISDSTLVHGLVEVKVEPENFYDSDVNQPKEKKIASNNDNNELLRCFDKSPENQTGEF